MGDLPPFFTEQGDIRKLPGCVLVKSCRTPRCVLNAPEGLKDTPELVFNKEDVLQVDEVFGVILLWGGLPSTRLKDSLKDLVLASVAAVGPRASSRGQNREGLVELEFGDLRRLSLCMARKDHGFATLGLLTV